MDIDRLGFVAYDNPRMGTDSSQQGILAAFFADFARSPPLLEVEAAALAQQLARMREAGVGAWPRIAVTLEQFASYLGEVTNREDADLIGNLARLHAEDLYLACGCHHHVPEAFQAFESSYLLGIDRFVGIVRSDPDFVDEVRQHLRQRLFVKDASGSAKISMYSGRGTLKGWIGVVAQRTALSLLRRMNPHRSEPLDETVDTVAALDDPELSYLRKRYGAEFRDAFRAALEILSERERLILHLNIVNGVTLDRIAAMYSVNQSTVSRWAATARQAVRDEVHRQFAERLSVTCDEFASLIRLLQSDLDLSISRAFVTGC
jgi:RNA polymerase sigma-70 factor, ECF subfamily